MGANDPREVARPIRGDVEIALEAGRRLAEVKPIDSPLDDGVPFVKLLNADGSEKLEFLRERFDAPARVSGTYTLDDVPSFLAYWARYADPESVCYASMEPAQFVAVIDHHTTTKNEPKFEEHRALHTLRFSKEWAEWTGRHGKQFDSNEQFALWLENQVPDIASPTGADMLAIALNFKVTSNAAFNNAPNLANGKVEFSYTNNVEGSAQVRGDKVSIPEVFTIEIPVFAGIDAPKYPMEARFRYRLGSGHLKLWFELVRPHKVIEAAFRDVLKQVQDKIGAAVLFGKPAAAD